jgi:hypothetical protein
MAAVLYSAKEMCWLDSLLENAREQSTLLRSKTLVDLLSGWDAAKLPAEEKPHVRQALAKLRQEPRETIALLSTGQFTWMCNDKDLYSIVPADEGSSQS